MINDEESKSLKNLDELRQEIPKIKNEIKALKTRNTKLTNKIESLELMAFQDQITQLNDNINSMNERMIHTSRNLALFELNFEQYHIRSIARSKLSRSDAESLLNKIHIQYGIASEKIINSNDPNSIVIEFNELCRKCSKENNLGAYGSG